MQLPAQFIVPQLPHACPKFAGVETLQLPLQVIVPPQEPQDCPKLLGVGFAPEQEPEQVIVPPQPHAPQLHDAP